MKLIPPAVMKWHRNQTGNIIMFMLFTIIIVIPDMYVGYVAFIACITIFALIFFDKRNEDIPNPLDEVHLILVKRYKKLLDEFSGHDDKIYLMLETLEDKINSFPPDKTSRWIGYIRFYLIENNLTNVQEERDFSRPLFHKAYKKFGYEIPKSVSI